MENRALLFANRALLMENRARLMENTALSIMQVCTGYVRLLCDCTVIAL